jgi:arylsulfatase
VPGATHAPHHPTPEWIKRVSDMHLFDQGWNALRDQIFANQKKLGVIPADAKMTPWPHDLLKNWDELSDVEKKLFIRQANVYAAYFAYADHEIGRVIQAVEDMGKLDDTLIIYISGDNGASSEGTLNGTPDETLMFNGINLTAQEQMPWYDAWGTERTYPHMAVPWVWAFDTPYKWTKQIPSFFGGTRQGAISWPGHIADKGGIRWQFHHVTNVVPTLLEATGIPAPVMVDGIAQEPIEGVSMAYTFDKANADAPTRHRTQYFEMLGVQGLYDNGWMLSAVPSRPPWDIGWGKINRDPTNSFKFELYDVRHDWTQNDDVAARNPTRMKEMTDLMFAQFAKYQVLPLDASVITRLAAPRPSLAAGRREFTYSGQPVTGIPNGAAPNVLATSYTITADIDVPQGGGEGVSLTDSGRFGGYGLYLLKGKPVFNWNLLGLKWLRWEGPDVSRLAGTLWNTTSSMTDLASRPWHSPPQAALAAAAPARSRWTARWSRPRRWSTPSRSCCRSTRRSTSARTPARRSTTATIRYRSRSPARSTSRRSRSIRRS